MKDLDEALLTSNVGGSRGRIAPAAPCSEPKYRDMIRSRTAPKRDTILRSGSSMAAAQIRA
jgi:hypothetical protein